MEIFRKFCIRKADLVSAEVDHVLSNTHDKTMVINIKERENSSSRLCMFLNESDVKQLMNHFRSALIDFGNSAEITDAQRLDWILENQNVEFSISSDRKGIYLIACLPDDEHGKIHFISRGKTRRDCIDMFIRGEAIRVE